VKRHLFERISGWQSTRQQILISMVLVIALASAAGVLAWSSARHLSSTFSDIEMDILKGQAKELKGILFQRNPYLQPDTFYLGKLESAFYEAEPQDGTSFRPGPDGEPVEMTTSNIALSNISINIRKGVQYTADLRSCYWMLEDPEAPWVLINGSAQKKDELTDTGWIRSCESMKADLMVEWRTMPLSYLNTAEVLSVYRRVTCESSRSGETITGYWVLNYHLSSIMNSLSAAVRNSENVILYNRARDDSVFAGNMQLPEGIREELKKAGRTAAETGAADGVIHEADGSSYYYLAEKICEGTVLMVCLQEMQLQNAMDRTTSSIVLVILVSSVVIVALNALNILRQRRYNQGLRKMIQALEATSGNGEEEAENPGKDLPEEMMIERILDNDVDLRELKGLLETQQELKAELDALYGHVQINSHFLLNTLDSIYWSSVRRTGADSRESAMLEDLCVILKYALDSSDLYTSLREEMECARMYIEIQQMRKDLRIETLWEVPEELQEMKVSKLILQPVIENCFQHGYSKENPGSLRIRISAVRTGNNLLEIRVADNGIGMNPRELKKMNQEMKRQKYLKSRHIGLANVNRRLQVQFGGESGVRLEAPEEGGLLVVLTMTCSPYARRDEFRN